jgi:hypothetical protein
MYASCAVGIKEDTKTPDDVVSGLYGIASRKRNAKVSYYMVGGCALCMKDVEPWTPSPYFVGPHHHRYSVEAHRSATGVQRRSECGHSYFVR